MPAIKNPKPISVIRAHFVRCNEPTCAFQADHEFGPAQAVRHAESTGHTVSIRKDTVIAGGNPATPNGAGFQI